MRTEGTLDPRTRMITAVARVDDPYGRTVREGQAPLPIGLFVDAEIQGRVVESVFEVPRRAFRERDEAVLLLDTEERLRLRRVEVLRLERDRVWIRGGLHEGEQVVTTPLDVFVEGMQVRRAVGSGQPGEAPIAGSFDPKDSGS